jgi:Holliday junction resolvase
MSRSAGQKAERKFAKEIGGKLQKRSGGIPGFPADCAKGAWLVECKSTVHDSMRLEGEWLRKIQEAAVRNNKQPVLVLIMPSRAGTSVTTEWCCVPRWLFERLKLWEAKI